VTRLDITALKDAPDPVYFGALAFPALADLRFCELVQRDCPALLTILQATGSKLRRLHLFVNPGVDDAQEEPLALSLLCPVLTDLGIDPGLFRISISASTRRTGISTRFCCARRADPTLKRSSRASIIYSTPSSRGGFTPSSRTSSASPDLTPSSSVRTTPMPQSGATATLKLRARSPDGSVSMIATLRSRMASVELSSHSTARVRLLAGPSAAVQKPDESSLQSPRHQRPRLTIQPSLRRLSSRATSPRRHFDQARSFLITSAIEGAQFGAQGHRSQTGRRRPRRGLALMTTHPSSDCRRRLAKSRRPPSGLRAARCWPVRRVGSATRAGRRLDAR
jgi:hypothetical protein